MKGTVLPDQPMETPAFMDGILVVVAIAILLGGLVMLFGGMSRFGDKS